jgi:hypothetical protein
MGAALVATLANPRWWAMALAAFLVRGGILLVVIPIISLPTTASVMTAVAPPLEALVLGRGSVAGVVGGGIVVALVFGLVAAAGLTGSWLDLALVREAADDEDVELGWRPIDRSTRQAFAIRLTAHTPTLLALGYATARVVYVGYDQLTSPGDTTAPVVERIIGQAPDALAVVVLAWLFGEAVGALAARRVAAGVGTTSALIASVRQVARPRGLATFALTTGLLIAAWLPFVLATSRAWEHLRAYLLGGALPEQLGAALVLLVATYVLGLAIAGTGLAWRATAWTAEVATASRI